MSGKIVAVQIGVPGKFTGAAQPQDITGGQCTYRRNYREEEVLVRREDPSKLQTATGNVRAPRNGKCSFVANAT